MMPTIMINILILLLTLLGVRATEYFCAEDCVMDQSMTPDTNDGTTCSYACTDGNIQMPCTTTSAKATTTTDDDDTVTPAPVIEGRCASIVKSDGKTYQSKCVIVDPNARCNADESKPVCACSIGFSGTTCNIADEHLKQVEKLMGGGPDAVAAAQKLLQIIEESKGSGGSASMIVKLPALLSFLNDSARIDMSYSASEVIAGATYEGQPLNVDTDFTRITDPSLGNCFTFNHYNATRKYKIRRIGEGGGLRVELDSMPNEYAPWTDVVGMTVFVHPYGQELNIDSTKYWSMAGSADQLVLTKSLFHKTPNGCAKDTSSAQSFYMSGHYTVDGCMRACYQDSVYDVCGCMDASYARKEGVEGCKFEKLTCISEIVADPVKWKECKCPQPCEEEIYDYVVSRASHLRNDNETLEESRSEVVIYFGTFEAMVSKEVFHVSISQVIASIGGVVILGFALSFLIKVVILGIILCCDGCKRKKPEKTPKSA